MDTILKQARKKIGLTKVKVAKQSKISVMSYDRYENEKRLPNVFIAQLIAIALNSTVEKLFPIDYLLQQEVDATKEPGKNNMT